MQTSAVSNSPVPGAVSKGVGQLGKEDFLRLLLAQLQNQDPLKPMEDTQFISQLAQFTTLERMQEMSDNMALLLGVEQLGRANGLIGKMVSGLVQRSGETVTGVVDSVKMVDGSPLLIVSGKPVRLADLLSVEDVDAWQLARASSLIGKDVTATLADSTTVEGTVGGVKVENGAVLLSVGDKDVRLDDLTSTSAGGVELLGQASSFIGKELEARVGTSGDTIKGVVDSVKRVDGKVVLMMGTRSVNLDDVISLAKGPDESQ